MEQRRSRPISAQISQLALAKREHDASRRCCRSQGMLRAQMEGTEGEKECERGKWGTESVWEPMLATDV